MSRRAAPRRIPQRAAASTTGTMYWNGRAITFAPGDSIAGALLQAGVRAFGAHPNGGHYGVFCGIGQCQGCLVADSHGQVLEACLRPCVDGARYHSLDQAAPDHG